MPPAASSPNQGGERGNESAALGPKPISWETALRLMPRRGPDGRCRHAGVAAAEKDSLHGPDAATDRILPSQTKGAG